MKPACLKSFPCTWLCLGTRFQPREGGILESPCSWNLPAPPAAKSASQKAKSRIKAPVIAVEKGLGEGGGVSQGKASCGDIPWNEAGMNAAGRGWGQRAPAERIANIHLVTPNLHQINPFFFFFFSFFSLTIPIHAPARSKEEFRVKQLSSNGIKWGQSAPKSVDFLTLLLLCNKQRNPQMSTPG